MKFICTFILLGKDNNASSITRLNILFWWSNCRLLHLSKPGVSTGVVPTAAAAAASLMSDGGGTTL